MATKHDPHDVVKRLLQTSLDTHVKRETMYGGASSQNVFRDTASISSIILRKDLNAFDIAVVFTAMKLSRYGNILELMTYYKDCEEEEEIQRLVESAWDSVLDAIVYIALSERERGKLKDQPGHPESM